MHTLYVIIGIHAVSLGFGFFFAGWMTLAAPSEQEMAAFKAQLEKELAGKSPMQRQVYLILRRSRARADVDLFEHWAQRPKARKLLYLGFAFLFIAAFSGYLCGAFN